jgi:opacity protein-like surface antigen
METTSPVIEVAGLVIWDIIGNQKSNLGFSPYLFGGAGLSFLRVSRDASNFDGEYFSTENAVTEGLNVDLNHLTPRSLLVFPVGAGVRYPLTELISLNAEAAYRIAFNDYVDGFSQAGNPSRKDHYHSISFGLLYRFKGSGAVKCPPALSYR